MASSSNALDVSAQTEDLKYIMASNVNVSNFVSVKLSSPGIYHIWKAQMLCLIQSQMLHNIIDKQIRFKGDMFDETIKKYDNLVKGWIFGTLNENVLAKYVQVETAIEVWMQLESYGIIKSYIQDDEPEQDMQYMQASNINVSCFVSVKLSGHNNYHIWKAQMLCLLESQNLVYFISQKKYDKHYMDAGMSCICNSLVRGWILGSMNEKLLTQEFIELETAWEVWNRLESIFNTKESDTEVSPEFKFETEALRDVPGNTYRMRLYEAAVEGCWWKAKYILRNHKIVAKEAITTNGNTILHLAVEMGHNYFVEKLLEFIKDGEYIETQNHEGQTALHIAVMVDNEYAAQLLVQKRRELLQIEDSNGCAPMHGEYKNMKLNMSTYLIRTTLPNLSPTPCYSRSINNDIITAILAKQYDLAESLLENFPGCASSPDNDILMAITLTFPTDLGFKESFIYPSFHNVYQKTVLKGSLLFHYNILDKCVDDISRVMKFCNNMCGSWFGKISVILLVPIVTLYPIYQLICILILVLHLILSLLYFLLWKVLANTWRPVKNIEKKKREYQEAKKVLSLICRQMSSTNDGYSEPILEAVRKDIYEVVDEILYTSPATINCKDEEGHNIIQLAIINRSDKVYNLISHIIERVEPYRTMMDSSANNIAHLAGKLAPSFVLDRITGAALQLQRELMWREEMKKLMSPIELIKENIYKLTPAMMFTREHKDLVKQGEHWIKTVAESCSITAALIVTIVFAAAITVPGGSNQVSGIPLFKKQIAFTIFAVFNAFSLFTGTTALLVFLSILTSRFSENDFLVSLPRRLIFGLVTLFLSTTAMIVAFGAILFLVYSDQRPWMLAPICGFACLPISVIITIKLPLLLDLIQSTYVPIFGKQSYLNSCKIKRTNTTIVNIGKLNYAEIC